MCGPLSPYDPIFFLHHAQVDKIWKDWQDQHLDVESEREWARDESWADMAIHICPQTAPNGVVNAADVEDSMDMTGPAQDGSVYYNQRQQEFQCEDTNPKYSNQWEAIQTCMTDISRAGKWHKVKRVVAGVDDVSDMCSERNPSNLKHNKMWLEAMVEAGHMTESEKDTVLTLHQSDLAALSTLGDRETQYKNYNTLSRCEKKMCMAITNGNGGKRDRDVRSVCKRLQQKAHPCKFKNDKKDVKRNKCRAKHWTWIKINQDMV